LFSDRLAKYYTGQCEDLDERMLRHNSGETKSIRNGVPSRVVWKKLCGSRGEAMLLEKKIKARGAGRHLADLGIDPGRPN